MKIGLLEQRHPSHDATELKLLRALAEGGHKWRDMVGTMLPKSPNEPADVYADRLARAVYHNYAGGILGLFAAYLFAEAPRVEGVDDEWFADWVDNVDRAGKPLSRWFRERFLDALVGRYAYAWVNLPARNPDVQFASRGEELQAGVLDAFLVGLTAEDVIDWGEDDTGALTWILFRQCVSERAAPTDPRTAVYRWTAIDRVSIQRWEWRSPGPSKPRPGPEDDATELPTIAHGMARLPVIRLELPEELWAMQLLRDPALAHLRSRNDLSWALNRTAHAMPVIKRKWGAGEDLIVGAGYFIRLEPEDSFEWTEPPGNSIVSLREDCAELREEIFRVVHQMALAVDNDASRARASGESKQTDWQATKVIMSAYADLVRSMVREVAELVVGVRSGATAPAITVQGLDGWQQLSLEEFLTGASIATQAGKMSPTFRREVAKREAARLLPDLGEATLAEIQKEIDASPEEDRIGGTLDSGVEKAGAWTVIKDYKAGLVDRAAAKNSLVSLYGLTPEAAELDLGDANHKPPAPPAPPGGLPGKPGAKPGAYPPKKPPAAAP